MPPLFTRYVDIFSSLITYFVRLGRHRQRVRRYAAALGMADTFWGRVRLYFHDWDKYLPARYYWYARYFCDQYSSATVVANFRHQADGHVFSNRHHWQFWIEGKTTLPPVHCQSMPLRDMLEMVADWQAMSSEKGTDPLKWYRAEKMGGRLYLHPQTALRVQTLLSRTDVDPREFVEKWQWIDGHLQSTS